ncbi:hypothetical protein D3C75_318990 [compost metagenome]
MDYTFIKSLGRKDIDLVLEMLESCLPFQYAERDTLEKLTSYCDKGFFIAGIFDGEDLAGYAVSSILVGESVKNTFNAYNVQTDREIWAPAGILNNCIIKDEYRGRGFQRELLKVREVVAQNNNVEEIYTSVHIKNINSIENLMRAGYKPLGQHIKSDEWIFFGKLLKDPVYFSHPSRIVL